MGRTSDARERLMKAVAELIWTNSYGSTTVDQICAKAGVRKGSFYHFFNAKSDLAQAAIEAEWEQIRGQLDRIFSPTVAPLDRLRGFCRHCHGEQAALKARFGHVLGCPMSNLGTEVSTQDRSLRQTVQTIMCQARQYIETTVRDAQAAGLVAPADPASRARMLYAYFEGLLAQARIEDDPDVLLEMEPGMLDILRVIPTSPPGKPPRRAARA